MARAYSMLRLSLLIGLTFVVSVTAHYDGHHSHEEAMLVNHKFIEKFTYKAAMDSCYGADIVESWYKWADNQMIACHNEMVDTKKHKTHDHTHIKTSEETPFYSADKVRHLKDHMTEKVEFINCTLNKMNMTVNAAGDIIADEIVTYYEGLQIPTGLKADTIQGVKDCAAVDKCHKAKAFGIMDASFMTKCAFVKCEKHQRMVACIRHTFRQHKMEFELAGLDGVLDDLKDDETRMIAVASAYLSEVKSHTMF